MYVCIFNDNIIHIADEWRLCVLFLFRTKQRVDFDAAQCMLYRKQHRPNQFYAPALCWFCKKINKQIVYISCESYRMDHTGGRGEWIILAVSVIEAELFILWNVTINVYWNGIRWK